MQNKKFSVGRFAGKGYYIALILCAVAIGISGYLYYHNANGDDPSLNNPNATVDVLNPEDTFGPTLGPQDSTPTKPSLPPSSSMKTGRPVDGKVILEYSMDALCYNPTTRDWRTHDGTDFAAEAGTPVLAAADGTVDSISHDKTMGTTVVIRHANGYITTYSSLASEVKVTVGDPVKLGQTIGTAASTALMETALGDHLHFSVTCDGESVDPEAFFNLA